MAPPGIIVGSNTGGAYGGGNTFNNVYNATSSSAKPFLMRAYGGTIMPVAYNDHCDLALANGLTNVGFVNSWKPSYSSMIAGTFDANITTFANSCQSYFNSNTSSVNPWPLFVTFWHEGERTLTDDQFKSLHAYVHPRFKAACVAYNNAHSHSGAPTVPYGAIMMGFEGKNIIQFFPAPSTTTGLLSGVPALTTMLDFYTFDNYLMGGGSPTATPASKLQWSTLISNLDLGGKDTYPNLGYTETNVFVGDSRTIASVLGGTNTSPYYDATGNNGPVSSPYATAADRETYINACWTYTQNAYNGTGGFAGYKGSYPGLFLTFWTGNFGTAISTSPFLWTNGLSWNDHTDTLKNANGVTFGAASAGVTSALSTIVADSYGGSVPPPASQFDTDVEALVGTTGEYWALEIASGNDPGVNAHPLILTAATYGQPSVIPTDALTSIAFGATTVGQAAWQPSFAAGVSLGFVGKWSAVPATVQHMLSNYIGSSNTGANLTTTAAGHIACTFGNGTTTLVLSSGIVPTQNDDVFVTATWDNGGTGAVTLYVYDLTSGLNFSASGTLSPAVFQGGANWFVGSTSQPLVATGGRSFVVSSVLSATQVLSLATDAGWTPATAYDSAVLTYIPGTNGAYWALEDTAGPAQDLAGNDPGGLVCTNVTFGKPGVVQTDTATSAGFGATSTATSSYQPSLSSGVTIGAIGDWTSAVVVGTVQQIGGDLSGSGAGANGASLTIDANGHIACTFGNGTAVPVTVSSSIKPTVGHFYVIYASWDNVSTGAINLAVFDNTTNSQSYFAGTLTPAVFAPTTNWIVGNDSLVANTGRQMLLPVALSTAQMLSLAQVSGFNQLLSASVTENCKTTDSAAHAIRVARGATEPCAAADGATGTITTHNRSSTASESCATTETATQRSSAHAVSASESLATSDAATQAHSLHPGTAESCATTDLVATKIGGGSATLDAGSVALGSGAAQATSLSFTIPSGVTSGDTILIFCANGKIASTWSSGTGKTAFTAQAASNTTTGLTCQLLTHVYTGTEGWTPGTTAITVTCSVSCPWAGVICAVGGGVLDPALSGSGMTTTASSTLAIPGVTTTHANDLLIWFVCIGTASGGTPGSITVPSGFTHAVTEVKTSYASADNVGVHCGTATAGAAGPTGTKSGTNSAVQVFGGVLVSFAAQNVIESVPAVESCATSDTATQSSPVLRTAAQSIATRDTAVGQAGHVLSVTEPVATSDGAVSSGVRARSVSEALTTTDSAATAGRFARSLSEQTVTTDTAAGGARARVASASEPCVSTASAVRTFHLARVVSEASATSDTATRSYSAAPVITEADTTTDSAGIVRVASRTASEASLSTDHAGTAHAVSLTVTETSATTDTASRLATHARSVAEPCASVASATRLSLTARSTAESSVSADNAQLTGGHHVTGAASEPSATVDLAQLRAVSIPATEPAATTDSVASNVALGQSASEGSASLDAASEHSTHVAATTEPSASTDSARISVRSRTASETTATSDSSARTTGLSHAGSEAVSILDAAVQTHQRSASASEANATTDSASLFVSIPRTVTEASLTTDALTTGLVTARSTSEASWTVDLAPRSGLAARSATEASSAHDSASRTTAFGPSSAELDLTGDGGVVAPYIVNRSASEANSAEDLAEAVLPVSYRFAAESCIAVDAQGSVLLRTIEAQVAVWTRPAALVAHWTE